ncbi:unnamed protein product [Paramecium pentaurelia]|uniref:Uncharacterized protein n=1 Tax=Paramecium pentaurelia TaxID=43138 RepID=A0A8S1V8F3_9CILI|nr:unnamed protein product [Paramecium pentaurelia]
MILDDFAEIDNEIINFLNDQILIPIIENTAKTLKQLSDNAKPIDEAQKQIVIFEQQNQQNLQNEEITKRIQCKVLNQKSVESQTQFQYDLIMQIEEKEDCWCMLFNKDETLLVTCHDSKKIKIYEFIEKKLKLLQILESHTSKLFAIQIHNITNQIIISDDKSILIWNYQQEEKKWSQGQILQQHDDSINCLISNQEETMLISGGDDCKINYWCKQEDNAMLWMLQGSIVVHKTKILSLSMNEKQDYLISSEYDNKIVICKLQQNKQWLHIQIIQLDTRCWRISFIINNLFIVQQENGILKTFYQQNINQEFLLHQQLKISEQQSCQYWFPLVYNKKYQILLNKHHNSIYFMREQNNILTGELSICFEEQDIWGTLSNNSEYLATWDAKSKQIQIRKQK